MRIDIRLTLLPLFVILAVSGAWVAGREASAYLVPGANSFERIVALGQDPEAPGMALSTRDFALRDCVRAVTRTHSLEARYLPADVLEALPDNCLAMANDLLSEVPSHSYAWYAGAAALAAMQDWGGMNQYLRRSQASGPTEQWIATERVALGERFSAHLEPATVAAQDADLRILVFSSRGVRLMARHYIANAAFRERITAIVETMTDAQQRRFLNVLRGQVASGS